MLICLLVVWMPVCGLGILNGLGLTHSSGTLQPTPAYRPGRRDKTIRTKRATTGNHNIIPRSTSPMKSYEWNIADKLTDLTAGRAWGCLIAMTKCAYSLSAEIR